MDKMESQEEKDYNAKVKQATANAVAKHRAYAKAKDTRQRASNNKISQNGQLDLEMESGEAFNSREKPIDKNKQDIQLSRCIMASIEAETNFKLYSYRIIPPNIFVEKMRELAQQINKI